MLLRHFVSYLGRDNDVMRCVGRENAWNPRGFIGQNPRGVHVACLVHAPCVETVQDRGYSTTNRPTV